MSKKNSELTMVVPKLNKRQATDLRNSLKEAKSRYAPNAKASIQIGKQENFIAIMGRCKRFLK